MELFITQHSPQFPKRKDGDESGEYDDTPTDQSVDADFAQNTSKRSTMDNPFDNFFNKVKGERKQAVHECLVDHGLIEWSMFKLLTEVRHFSDENDVARSPEH